MLKKSTGTPLTTPRTKYITDFTSSVHLNSVLRCFLLLPGKKVVNKRKSFEFKVKLQAQIRLGSGVSNLDTQREE